MPDENSMYEYCEDCEADLVSGTHHWYCTKLSSSPEWDSQFTINE